MVKALPLLFLFVVGCVSKEPQARKGALTVMTYNVENLFDTLDDPSKDDETYLPIEMKKSTKHKIKCAGIRKDWWRQQCLETDWSESKVKRKISRLSNVILQVNNGEGPDILILQEVENLNILERLRLNGLEKAGYKEAVLIEGPDLRGIDVAMLSKLPLSSTPKLIKLELGKKDKKTGKIVVNPKQRPTRGILQARFKLPDGENLTVFGVHFPSQGGPTRLRRQALEALSLVKSKLPANELVIAAGDFNITAQEDGREGLFKSVSKDWLVSHKVGCDKCEGTHNYRGSWSFLDVILFSKNFQEAPWKLDVSSIRIPNKSIYQLNHFGGPARFNDGRSQKGVSDHWPLAADIYPGERQ